MKSSSLAFPAHFLALVGRPNCTFLAVARARQLVRVSGVSLRCTDPPNGRRTKRLEQLELLGSVQCRVRYGMRYQDIRTSQLKSYDVGQDIRIYGHLHCCRCQGGYVTCRAAVPLWLHWPLPMGSHCPSLLVLRLFGGSVHRSETPDTLASYTFLVLVGWLSLTDCQPESLCSRRQT